MPPSIRFFFEGVKDVITSKRKHQAWIKTVIQQEGKSAGDINIIFCTDQALLKMNRLYLAHDTFTDVISFNLEEGIGEGERVTGDIYISLDRVRENAVTFNVKMEEEIRRVIVHGTLHLLGYHDDKPVDRNAMKGREDLYLSLF